MSEYPIRGSCLCRRVRYEIDGDVGIFQYCHCSRCRKFTGSAFAANLLVRPDQFRWTDGEQDVRYYALPDAKHFATAFCAHCGSSLPWPAQSGRTVVVPAGTLDGEPPRRPAHNLFCASRAVWYTDPAKLPEYDELPPRRS